MTNYNPVSYEPERGRVIVLSPGVSREAGALAALASVVIGEPPHL